MSSEQQDVAKSDFSPVLFMSVDGEPMTFFLRPGHVKRKLQPLITAGAGMLCNAQHPGAIMLVDPEERSSIPETTAHWYVSTQYIHDCIDQDKQLNLEDYRLNPEVVPRQSARLNKNKENAPIYSGGTESVSVPEGGEKKKRKLGNLELAMKEFEDESEDKATDLQDPTETVTMHPTQTEPARPAPDAAASTQSISEPGPVLQEEVQETQASNRNCLPETSCPQPAATEPAATEPTATEPVATEPAATEHAATEPAATEHAATEHAATEPAATEPAATKHAATEPTATEHAATELTATEPTVTEHAATEHAATEPEATEHAATEPTATEPTATKHAATELAATEPAATEPAATEHAATEHAATEHAATEHAATEPTATEHAATELTATEPTVTEHAATEHAATEPEATEHAATEPTATKHAATEPAATEPAATEHAVTEHAVTEHAATEHAATEPAATEHAATEHAATEPAATKHAATEPAATGPAAVSVTSKAHLFIFDSESEEEEDSQAIIGDSTAALVNPQPAVNKDTDVSLTHVQLEEDMQRIKELMKETNQDLVSVTKALLKTSGDLSDARNLLLNPSSFPGTLWKLCDDDLLRSGDPVVQKQLLEKYSEEAVAKRIVFLDLEG